MLTIFQRLLLGGLLLLSLLAGLSLAVRHTFVSLSALDARGKGMDRAVATMAAARASLSREQILLERSLLHLPADAPPDAETPDPQTKPALPEQLPAQELRAQSKRAEERLTAARDALAELGDTGVPAINVDAELNAHHRLLARLNERAASSSARPLEPVLETTDASLSHKLVTLEDRRARLEADLELEREGLSARLIAICVTSLLMGVLVLSTMLVWTTRPLRQAARAARRMGQGDLTQRIDWPRNDELGTLTTEFNRMAIKLRDLRDTESGRREMDRQMSDAVVQSLFEPVIVTDGRGQLLKMNKAARELLGEAADRMMLPATPGGDQMVSAIQSAIQTAISLQRTVGGEGEAAVAPMRIGQTQRDYRLRTTPMRDNEGHLLGAVTVLEDVTELQALDRFKTRFLAIASGKLRNPLEKLRLAIHALARGYAGELRPLQADVVEGAQNEAQRLDDLMADLFAVAELDSGRHALKLDALRPIDLLREAGNSIRAAALERGLTVEIDAYADLQRVEADRRALRSVFENLLSNAVRFTPVGGTIRLGATEVRDAVQFRVTDTGRGIEPERLGTIFGRFNSGSEDGTGLGLALVRRLVEAQGGQITADSRLGAGTTFSFTLRAAAPAETRHPVEAG